MPRNRLVITLAAVVVLHLLVAGWFAGRRPIDGDEGYYGLAARLVAEGQRPYDDFFYPQAPLLPYLYAPAARLVDAPQLPDLRFVSVALGGLSLVLTGAWLARAHGSRPGVAVAALLLLALSPELLTWTTTVKTYALTTAAVAGALLAFSKAATGPRGWRWALPGGVALGLAASARLLYAPAAFAPVVLFLLPGRRRRPGAAGAWAAGAAVGMTPVWLAWLARPDRFWFNNVGYHRLRFSALEDAPLWLRATEAGETLAISLLANPGLAVLVALAAWGVAARRGEPAADPAADGGLLLAVVYTLTCLLPDPVYMQYVTSGLPVMLLPAAATGLARLPWPGRRVILAGAVVAPALAIASLGWIRHDLSPLPHWRLDHYRRVCGRIAAGTRPGDMVFAFWSGYVAGSGRQPVPGMENHFAVGVSERLDAVARRRYEVPGRRELARVFRREAAAMVVVGGWMYDIDTALDHEQMTRLLAEFHAHYAPVEEIAGIKLCLPLTRLRDGTPGADDDR